MCMYAHIFLSYVVIIGIPKRPPIWSNSGSVPGDSSKVSPVPHGEHAPDGDRWLLVGPGRAATGEAAGDVLLVIGFGQGTIGL